MKTFLYFRQSQLSKILVCRIIEFRETSSVFRIAFRDADNHALAGASEKNAICIELIGTTFSNVDILPAVTSEIEMLPAIVLRIIAEAQLPYQASPIEFKPLNIKLCCHIFKE